MDGVLCYFNSQWKTYYGKLPKDHILEIGKEKFDELLTNAPIEFWTKMPWQPGGRRLWDIISDYDTVILSSPSNSKVAGPGKAKWLKNYGIHNTLILAQSYDKHQYAKPNHILIDDYKRNVNQWKAAGGIAILHTNLNNTLEQLEKLKIV
jgi:hypothetical protein